MAHTQSHPFVGYYVICRCSAAGVHAGVLVSTDGDAAVLADSRRLWRWSSAGDGIALSGVAQLGLNKASTNKVDATNPFIEVRGVAELIPCSAVSEASIRGAP